MKNITKKSYSPAFKTRVVKEILKQEKTVSQISSEYKIHPTQAHEWRKKGILQMQEGFKNPLKKDSRAKGQEELIAKRKFKGEFSEKLFLSQLVFFEGLGGFTTDLNEYTGRRI